MQCQKWYAGAVASDTIRQHCLFCWVKRIDCVLGSSPANAQTNVEQHHVCTHIDQYHRVVRRRQEARPPTFPSQPLPSPPRPDPTHLEHKLEQRGKVLRRRCRDKYVAVAQADCAGNGEPQGSGLRGGGDKLGWKQVWDGAGGVGLQLGVGASHQVCAFLPSLPSPGSLTLPLPRDAVRATVLLSVFSLAASRKVTTARA